MTLSTRDEKSIQALVTALSRQSEPLPANLQAQLQAIGQNLGNRAVELPTVAASLPRLSSAYQEALSKPQPDAGNTAAKLVSSSSQDDGTQLVERAAEIFTSSDPVQAAQEQNTRSFGQIASNPFRRFFRKG
ncbi:MAG: hypothetical protein WA883_02255 [Phormidesmis sp.]